MYEQLIGAGIQDLSGLLGQRESRRHRTESGRLAAEAQAKRVPLEDPEQRMYLNELQRKRRAAETGYAYQDAASKLGQEQALASDNILRASGGAGGAAIASITNAQRATGYNMAKVAQQGEQTGLAYSQLYGNLLDTVAQRKADLQLNDYQRLLAQSEQERQAADETGMGATSELVGAGADFLNGLDLGSLIKRPKNNIPTSFDSGTLDAGINDYSIGGLRRNIYGRPISISNGY